MFLVLPSPIHNLCGQSPALSGYQFREFLEFEINKIRPIFLCKYMYTIKRERIVYILFLDE
jgi:hypothetical protein